MTREELDGNRVFAIHDFLSGEECAALVRRSESLGYELAKVNNEVDEQFRNNQRVLLDDPTLAAELFLRARPFLPGASAGWVLAGFNERWRFYRYSSGQTFKPHFDGRFARDESWEESHLTFMVYLNDRITGGETRFFMDFAHAGQKRPYLTVKP